MTTVKIKEGSYRNNPIKDVVFPLVKGYTHGTKGAFVTVDGTGVPGFPQGKFRIRVPDIQSVEVMDGDESELVGPVNGVPIASVVGLSHMEPAFEPDPSETDDEAKKRIAERFEILEEVVIAVSQGIVRGLVATGAAGLGKSFVVEQTLEKSKKKDFTIIRGFTSAINIYKSLYEYKEKGQVVVYDDCDAALFNESATNLIKAALDSSTTRRLSWKSESKDLEDVPKTFEFKGAVIFITNINFEHYVDSHPNGKLTPHLKAILSRCHYVDLTLDTVRDRMLRIEQVVQDRKRIGHLTLTNEEAKQILDYMKENQGKLRELSLRMALNIAELLRGRPGRWQVIADKTCIRRRFQS